MTGQKPRKPLKRSTKPMKRTQMKRGTKRMKRSSTTNSKPHRDARLYADYLEQNNTCELWGIFHEAKHPVCGGRSLHPAPAGTERHHIFRGIHRVDHESNIIVLCHDIHALDDTKWATELKIASLWRKQEKGELDYAALNAMFSSREDCSAVQEWLRGHRGIGYFESLRRSLLTDLGMRFE